MNRHRTYQGALLGLGTIARAGHLAAFLEDPVLRDRVRIVAGVETAPDGLGSSTPDDPLRRVEIQCFTSHEMLAEVADLDFVDICTPTATHLELALWALERGYHVLCEKPVALNSHDAHLLEEASHRAGRLLVPCHQYRFNPAWLQLRAWLQEDAIGEWHLAEISVYRPRADPGIRRDAIPWRGRRAESRGGILLDHGTHWLYLLLDLAGPPSTLQAWRGRLAHHEYDVEDTFHLTLEYPNRLATLFLTWAGGKRENRVYLVGEHGTIEWTDTTLRLDANRRTKRLDLPAQHTRAAYVGWFALLFNKFIDALDRGAPAPFGNEVTRVAELLEASYTACENGRRQKLTAYA
jgi:predicted dehydrogenase